MSNAEMLCGAIALCLLACDGMAAGEVTNAAELAQKYGEDLTWEDYTAYRAIVDALPDDERRWEQALEHQLGSYYFPLHVRARIQPDFDPATYEAGWGFVRDDPALPRVILIGDSISRSYTMGVRRALAGVANVHRAPANCGSTATALGFEILKLWLNQGGSQWDVVYFNFGIHDRNRDGEEYAANLVKIIEALRQTGATLIFARTTPFENEDAPGVDASVPLNAISDAVMAEHGVAVDDLHGAVAERVAELQGEDHVHFTAEGIAVLAEHVAATIRAALEAREAAAGGE